MRREGAGNLPDFDLSYINEILMTESEFFFFLLIPGYLLTCSQIKPGFLPREPSLTSVSSSQSKWRRSPPSPL